MSTIAGSTFFAMSDALRAPLLDEPFDDDPSDELLDELSDELLDDGEGSAGMVAVDWSARADGPERLPATDEPMP